MSRVRIEVEDPAAGGGAIVYIDDQVGTPAQKAAAGQIVDQAVKHLAARTGQPAQWCRGMHARYGMAEGGFDDPDFRTPEQLQQIINDGLTEMYRLVQPSRFKKLHPSLPNGIVLVKCKDYIWSGRYFPGAHHTVAHALEVGFVIEDRFELVGDPGPQPATNPDGSPRGQKHARRNLSTLLVLRRVAS